MTPEQRNQTSRLFIALQFGEQLAHKCAIHQSKLLVSEKSRRFLRMQARQEAFHANLFKQAANWLKPTHCYETPPALKLFAQHLDRAMMNLDTIECLVASQIVLEGFGEQILLRLNKGMDKHNVGFKRQRYIILQQEQSHYNFGLRALKTYLKQGKTTPETIQSHAEFYLELVDRIIEEMCDIFAALNQDADHYKQSLVRQLPIWLYSPRP